MKNKIVLITGASKGIGQALAAKLIASGAKVYSFSRTIPREKLPGLKYLKVDVSREIQVKNGLKKIPGKIDVLVNNAGVMRRGLFDQISEKDFDLVLSVNLKGPWLIYKNALKKMKSGGTVLQINSKNGFYLKEDTFVYSLSKAAQVAMLNMIVKSATNLDFKIAYLGPVDTELEWTGYNAAQKAAKMKEAITTEKTAELLNQLLISKNSELIYTLDRQYIFR